MIVTDEQRNELGYYIERWLDRFRVRYIEAQQSVLVEMGDPGGANLPDIPNRVTSLMVEAALLVLQASTRPHEKPDWTDFLSRLDYPEGRIGETPRPGYIMGALDTLLAQERARQPRGRPVLKESLGYLRAIQDIGRVFGCEVRLPTQED